MKKFQAPRLRGIFIPLFLFISFLASALTDNDVASLYFDQAEALFQTGNMGGAVQLLSTSLQFFPDYSESLYLDALISLRSQGKTRDGIDFLRHAIKAATWSKSSPEVASRKLAEVLVRTDALEEAIPLLQALVARDPRDSQSRVLLAMAHVRSGKADVAEKTAMDALKRFPKAEGLWLTACRAAALQGKTDAARAYTAAGLHELPDSLPLLLRAAELEPDPIRRLRAVDDYLAKGGTDPLASVIALEAEPKEAQAYLSRFIRLKGLERLDLTWRVSEVAGGSTILAGSFKAELEKYSGVRDLVAQDGFYRERWEYLDGKPVRWTRDENADGAPELAAEYSDGSIAALTFFSIDFAQAGSGSVRTVSFHFDEYPFITTANEIDRTGSSVFSLIPHILGCSLADGSMVSYSDEPLIVARYYIPTPAQILQASFHEDDFAAGASVPFRRIDLAEGRRVYMEEDTDRDGIMDHEVWYSDGEAVRGLRDATGSGAFATTEMYRDGRLWEILADTTGDGKVDYKEQWNPEPVKYWDYNGDGIFDGRETAGANGSTIRDFSTALNGTYDLRVIFQKGAVISVMQNGRKIPLTPDPAKGLVWIGTPYENTRVSAKSGEGISMIDGQAYLMFRFGNTMYIEALQ